MEKLLEEQEESPKKNNLSMKDFMGITNVIIPGGFEGLLNEYLEPISTEVTRVKPLSPSDITDGLSDIIPGYVIESVNNLLKKKYRGGSCRIKQKDIIFEAKKLAKNIGEEVTDNQIYDNKWMDFEEIFRKAGWKVTYDGPGYNESYDATFEFTKK
jgi:hypothetical protein